MTPLGGVPSAPLRGQNIGTRGRGASGKGGRIIGGGGGAPTEQGPLEWALVARNGDDFATRRDLGEAAPPLPPPPRS